MKFAEMRPDLLELQSLSVVSLNRGGAADQRYAIDR